MDPLSLIDKYYSDNAPLRQLLLTHSHQVADRAMSIVDAHPELSADRQFVYEAAMLHDIGIMYCNAPKIYCTGAHAYIEHGYLGAELLRKEGLPRHADVAERHTGTGLTLEQVLQSGWPIPHQDYSPRTIEEQIICYADKFYSKSHVGEEVAYSKLRQTLWYYGSESVQRFDKWQALFEPNLITTKS